MAKLKCDICEAEGFKSAGALAIHKKTKCEPIFKKPKYSSTQQMGSTSQQTSSLHASPYEIVDDDIVDQMEYVGEDIPYLPQTQSFDSTFSLVHWMRTCNNGGGLSTRDITSLFKNVLFHQSFKLEDVSVKSSIDVENYGKSLYIKDDGWKEHTIRGQILHYRDPIDALRCLYSSPAIAEGFTIVPTDGNTAERVYSTPASGTWWHDMQVSY